MRSSRPRRSTEPGPVRRVRYIIWPGVRYMTLLVAIISLLSFTNGSFDLVNILTKGGPLYASQTLIYYIFVNGFSYGISATLRRSRFCRSRSIAGILLVLRLLSKADGPMMRSCAVLGRRARILTRDGHRAAARCAALLHGRRLGDVERAALDPAAAGDPELACTSRTTRQAFTGLTQVIQVRSFLNSVIFTVGAVGLQWMLCISGGLVIAKMRFRGPDADHGDVGDLAVHPARHDADPDLHRHLQARPDQHLCGPDPPDRGPDRLRDTALSPVHLADARGALRRRAHRRRKLVDRFCAVS